MVTVTKLSHVGFRAQNLSNQAEFYNDRWGLERVDEHGGEIFFRADGPDHHVLTLHEADAPGLHHFAFEVASADDLNRAADELSAIGLPIITPPTADLEPGVKKAMRFCDPEGNLVELVAGVDSITEPYGNRDVKPVGLNHVVLEARDRVALESFYRDKLGFQLTDQLADFMTFFRCNANHHSLAFLGARDGQPGFNHAAFEIRNWEEWIKAVFYAGEKGIPRFWGPGRHLAGNNLFSYYRDPENNTVEYTAEVEQITAADYVPKVRVPPMPDQWKTVGPSVGRPLMVTADRATDLDIDIPDVPPIADRPRTLDEAKAFLTRHLLTGRMPFPREAHREVYDTIQALPGLDGANWAATWAVPADRHEALAEAATDPTTELQERLLAYQFNFYGRYPSPNHPAKLERYQRGVASFLRAAPLLSPPVDVIRIPFEASEIVCYLRKPVGVERPPVVFAWAGIDTWKEEMALRVDHYLQVGLAVLTTDMPGTGQSPVVGSPDAERQYTPVFEWLRSRDDLAGDRVVIVGASFGGYWATKLAHTHREYLRGAVSWGGGAHFMYQRPWLEKSRYSDTYLMELPETRARMLGASSFEEYAERIQKLSLLDQGVLDTSCAPMLLVNGKQDSQCPIDDLYILLEHGDPKTARVFEGGHMAPGPRTVATIAKWVGERLA